MNPDTIYSILKVSKLCLDSVKKDIVINKLEKIQETLDQLILREVKSAYDSIIDSMITNNEQTKNIRLKFAEESLLRNTNLNPSLKTGDIQNSYLMALAHYGLAFVCLLRGDFQITAKHLIKIYEVDPRNARIKLVPLIFNEIFKPKCSSIFLWYEEEVKKIQKSNFILKVVGGKLCAVGAGAIVVGSVVLGGGGTIGTLSRNIANMWIKANPEDCRKKALEDLYNELESKLDIKSQEISRQFLSMK